MNGVIIGTANFENKVLLETLNDVEKIYRIGIKSGGVTYPTLISEYSIPENVNEDRVRALVSVVVRRVPNLGKRRFLKVLSIGLATEDDVTFVSVVGKLSQVPKMHPFTRGDWSFATFPIYVKEWENGTSIFCSAVETTARFVSSINKGEIIRVQGKLKMHKGSVTIDVEQLWRN